MRCGSRFTSLSVTPNKTSQQTIPTKPTFASLAVLASFSRFDSATLRASSAAARWAASRLAASFFNASVRLAASNFKAVARFAASFRAASFFASSAFTFAFLASASASTLLAASLAALVTSNRSRP